MLDQQKKWWLVRSRRGEEGYVPSNILEPVGHEDNSQVCPPLPRPISQPRVALGGGGKHPPTPLHPPPPQGSPPSLHMGSSPAEVTAWLKDKGFAPLCVAP